MQSGDASRLCLIGQGSVLEGFGATFLEAGAQVAAKLLLVQDIHHPT